MQWLSASPVCLMNFKGRHTIMRHESHIFIQQQTSGKIIVTFSKEQNNKRIMKKVLLYRSGQSLVDIVYMGSPPPTAKPPQFSEESLTALI